MQFWTHSHKFLRFGSCLGLELANVLLFLPQCCVGVGTEVCTVVWSAKTAKMHSLLMSHATCIDVLVRYRHVICAETNTCQVHLPARNQTRYVLNSLGLVTLPRPSIIRASGKRLQLLWHATRKFVFWEDGCQYPKEIVMTLVHPFLALLRMLLPPLRFFVSCFSRALVSGSCCPFVRVAFCFALGC